MFFGAEVVLQSRGMSQGWQGIAVERPAGIVIVDDGTPGADASADELASATELAIDGLTPTAVKAVPSSGGCGCAACAICTDMQDTHLLVWVTGFVAPTDTSLVRHWAKNGWGIVCVLPAGAAHDSVIPQEARDRHALVWQNGIAEVVPEVLTAAGLVPRENRMFITYRHGEGRELAEELFHLLSEHRFAVFLDHFSLPPGVAFLEQLEQELLDKAFVVVCESPTINDSDWVKHEVRFAIKRRLGLAAVAMAGAATVRDIDDAERVRLADDEWISVPALVPSGRASRLSKSAVGRVVATIKTLHHRAMVHRREILDSAVRAALAKNGAPDILPSPIIEDDW